MNTKNIFKTLALAMLMPAMMLTTACSSEDDLVNNTAGESTASTKGYPFPVTVNVTRQGDATTRATYNESTRTLSFSTGDKLFVSGYYGGYEKQFAGTLDYDAVSGKFSGTIYTESEYTGTAEALLAGADDPIATLVPAGYDTYGYLSIKNEGSYLASLSRVNNKEFALTKKAAVEQFSSESAYSYSSGFALAPENAIVSFTISGLTANKEVAVSFDVEGTGTISGNVTTSATGVATFAVGVYDNCELENCTLTVGGNNIALPTNTVEKGHIYNISRSVPPAEGHALSASAVGEIVGTDGKAYAAADKDNLPSGVTAVAMVAYKSGSNGLAIQLNGSPEYMNWTDAKTYAEGLTAVTGGTWRLPSMEDWQNMFVGCAVSGDASASDDMDPIAGFKAKIAATGITWRSDSYWSSTESGSNAWSVLVNLSGGSAIANFFEFGTSNSWRVLGCLAF